MRLLDLPVEEERGTMTKGTSGNEDQMQRYIGGEDPQWREKFVAVMREWQARGVVEPGWSVEWDRGDGCYRTTFFLWPLVTHSGQKIAHRYSFNEAEMCQYVLGLVDLAPDRVGEASVALADASREEEE